MNVLGLHFNFFQITAAALSVLAFAAVRYFEHYIFYDPFIDFFKTQYQALAFPEVDLYALLISVSFRFFLNAIIGLVFIKILFLKPVYVKAATLVYLVAYLVFMLAYFLLVKNQSDYFFLFYVRKFLIHPILLLILLPAIFFNLKFKENEEMA
ncbi:MAG: exosortase F system-associated protein [Flavobacteriaceae bacterium]|nr:exosortase F system-associated protein [Flavobacteriaceae bacterium]